jgi:hypothetical protein
MAKKKVANIRPFKVPSPRTPPRSLFTEEQINVLVDKLRYILAYAGDEYPIADNRDYAIRTIGEIHDTMKRFIDMGAAGRRKYWADLDRRYAHLKSADAKERAENLRRAMTRGGEHHGR